MTEMKEKIYPELPTIREQPTAFRRSNAFLTFLIPFELCAFLK